MIGSHAADEELLAMLRDQTTDEKDLQAAIASAASLELECGRDFIKLLSHPMVTVRECVSGQLRAHWDAYSAVVYDALPSAGDLPAGDEGDQVTETRMLLTTLQRLTEIPPVEATDRVALLLSNEDWGVRADAVLLIKHWHGMELEGETRKAVAAYYNGLSQRMEKEEHPYVIHAWQREY